MVTRLRHLRTLNLRNNDIEGRIDDVLWGVELGPEVVQRDDGEEEETEEDDDDDDNDDDDPAKKKKKAPVLGGLKRNLRVLDLSGNARLGGRLEAEVELKVSDDGSDALAAFNRSLKKFSKQHALHGKTILNNGHDFDDDEGDDDEVKT